MQIKLMPLLWLLTLATTLSIQTPSFADTKKDWRVVVVSTLPTDESQAFLVALDARISRALLKTGIRATFDMVVMRQGQTVEQTVADALRIRPDLLVVMAASLAAEAHRQAPQIPIVFKTLFDPVATGLVESVVRPGRNMTGYSNHAAIHEKRWEMIAQAVPHVRKIGVLLNQTYYGNIAQRLPMKLAGGLEVVLMKWQPGDGLAMLEQLVRRGNVGALDVGRGVAQPPDEIALLNWARDKKIPTVFYAHWYVQRGGLLAHEAIQLDSVAVLSQYVQEILHGASAGNLPVSYPKLFSTSINARTAALLNLSPPPAFLKRVDIWESN